MQHNKVSPERNAIQGNKSFQDAETISPLRALVDPRFSSLLVRAANRERPTQQQLIPANRIYSPSTVNANSNAWLPQTSTTKIQATEPDTKKFLTPTWKNRLQGLLIGLLVAAIGIGIVVAVFLTRPSTNSTTSTNTTGCATLQWNSVSVVVAGNGSYGNASNQLYYPYGVYVDSNNAIYIADYYNHRIQKWLQNAVNGTTVAGVTGVCGSGGGMLCYPTRIYGDSQQNLYIADSYGIYLWPLGSSVGTMISGSNTSTIGTIYGIFVDNNQNLYASVSGSYSVMMWTSSATAGTIVAGGNNAGYSLSNLYIPFGLTVDSSTNTIYVANFYTQTIIAWKSGATSGTIAVGRNGTIGASNSLLRNPRDVKRDSNGNLYVLDTGNYRALLFCQNPPSTTGISITDTGSATLLGIALDSNLNVYIVDYSNHRILKFNRIV